MENRTYIKIEKTYKMKRNKKRNDTEEAEIVESSTERTSGRFSIGASQQRNQRNSSSSNELSSPDTPTENSLTNSQRRNNNHLAVS